MIRVSDYIMNHLHSLGVKDIFLLTGGGAMFLNDAVAKHPHMNPVCNHHEQACAMAAVGYSKVTNGFSAALLTTGCGSTNAITGLLDAWQDNLPCVFISGQIKRKETTYLKDIPLRQIGVQEANIVEIVKSITKYAIMVDEPNDIAYHMEKACYLAKSGRPGPVWLDIPLDVQGANVDENDLKHFEPESINSDYKEEFLDSEYEMLIEKLKNAKRPIVIAGNGIQLSSSQQTFKKMIERLNIPSVCTFLGVDLIPYDHPLFVGKIGIKGDRAGNFAMQNSDLVISLGSRLSVPSTGFEYDLFAREAEVVVVDIDPNEHKKDTVKIDLFINADLKNFFKKMEQFNHTFSNDWVEKCNHWKDTWQVCLPEYVESKEKINLYYFMEKLSEHMRDDDIVVCDAGSAGYASYQGIKIKNQQRFLIPAAQMEMGFTLPGAIGACYANDKKDIIGITGDGSFQLNIQELQTYVSYNLPIKIFIWNNNGYLSIRATQSKFFEGRKIGTDSESGVSFPDLQKIADAYGTKYVLATCNEELDGAIKATLDHNGPVLCEIISPENQPIIPAVSSLKKEDGTLVSKPLEDMAPFLDRDEFTNEMIIKPIEE